MEFKFRDYQEEAIQKGLEVLRDPKGRREIITAVTSSGKSLIISGVAKELTDGKILCLQPDSVILTQNLKKIESFGVYPSVYCAGLKRKELSSNLIYATPKSISYDILKDQNIKYVIQVLPAFYRHKHKQVMEAKNEDHAVEQAKGEVLVKGIMNKVIERAVYNYYIDQVARFKLEVISIFSLGGVFNQELEVFVLIQPRVEIDISTRFTHGVNPLCIRNVSGYLIGGLIEKFK